MVMIKGNINVSFMQDHYSSSYSDNAKISSNVYCSAGDGPEEKDSDRILAFAVSASGKHVALTDDHKRLVLFCTEPSWQCINTR